MTTLIWILLSTFSIALIAWIGVLFLFVKEDFLRKIILYLVSFSAGALIGGAFLHLLPESIEKLENQQSVFLFVILGFSIFFLLEQFIHWHHCHKMPSEHQKPFTYLVLISDSVHNFIDGIVMGSAFCFDVRTGIITWLVIAAHEIPQELGDFGVLIHGGWKKIKALMFNFISAFTVVIGGVVAYFISSKINIAYLLAFAAGSFIYIASSDLIPEIKHHNSMKKNLLHFLFFLLGILFILVLRFVDIE